MITINDFSYAHDNHLLFNNLSLEINNKGITSIVMGSMQGKTTLFNLFKEAHTDSHTIYIDNDFTGWFTHKRVIDYLKPYIMDYDEKIRYFTNLYNFDLSLNDNYISDLTNLQKLKLMLLIISLNNPGLIIVDNTFHRFYQHEYLEAMRLLKRCQEAFDNQIIYFTHTLQHQNYSNRIIVIAGGEVKIDGNLKKVAKEYKKLEKYGLELPFYGELSKQLILYNKIDDIKVNRQELGESLW